MRPLHICLAVLVAAIWGVNFVVIHVGIGSLPPLLLGAVRFVVAALPVLFIPKPAISWSRLIAVATALFVGQFGLLFTGMAVGMTAGLASVVLQAQAFFTIVAAALLLRERPRPRQLAGMMVAAAGLLLIAGTAGSSGVTALGLGLCFAAALSWGIGNVLLREAGKVDMFATMVWLSLIPPLPFLALSLILEGPARDFHALAGIDLGGVGAILYISVLSTLVGFGLWGQLLKLYPAATVAPFSLLVPIFGASSSALLLHESFSTTRLVGMGLLLIGVAIVALPIAKWLGWRPRTPHIS